MIKLAAVINVFAVSSLAMASEGDVEQTLINGRPADPKDFPASINIRYGSSGGYSSCTATVVAERVVISAAHCMNNNGQVSFSVGPNNYTAKCTHHPSYRGNSTADWALCYTNNPVTGIVFEKFNTDASAFKVGEDLLLTGYGCIRAGGSGGNDGIYRIGASKITSVPKPSGTNHDIVTAVSGGGALCYGDSGGPAFLVSKDGKERSLVGINSRGDISVTSYLSSVSQDTAKSWAESWATTNSARICGLHADAKSCRNAAPTTPPTAQCSAIAERGTMETWQGCLSGDKTIAFATCEEALDLMGRCYLTRYQQAP